MSNIGNNIFQGMIWSAIERISIQGIQLVLGIVLGNLLGPKEFGKVALLVVFITISQVFIDSGFTKALIQKKDRNEDDKSTVFIFNILISLFCYTLLWFSAPVIAEFYNDIELVLILKVLALSLIINALFSVPATLITINMDFKLFTKVNLVTTVISGLGAIYLAYMGYGVWALIIQTLIKALLSAILIWRVAKWKPNFKFSKTSFYSLSSFGSKLLISSLLNTVSSQVNALLIGKYIGSKELGIYSQGIRFADIIQAIFTMAISNVLLPGLAPIQDQKEKLTEHTRTIYKTTALITAPIFLVLALLSEPIIRLLLPEVWIGAAPIMSIFCIARFITILSGISVNLLYVIGKTDLVLKQQYYKIAIRIVLLVSAIKFGIIYIAIAELVTTTIHFFINTYYPGKIMEYGAFKQIKDIIPVIASGCIMLVVTYFSILYIENGILKIVFGGIIAVIIYLAMVYFFKIKEFNLLLNKSKLFLKK